MTDMAKQVAKGWVWPRWGDDHEPRGRRERFGRMFGPAVFLVFLIQPVTSVFGPGNSLASQITVTLAVICFGASYLGVSYVGNRLSHRNRLLAIGWLAIFPITFAFFIGPEGLVFFTFVVSPALMMWPRNLGALLGLSTAAALLISSRVVEGHVDWGDTWTLVVLTAAMFAFGALLHIIGELRRTQDKMARLAVAEERSRLARDLHDVLGHSLTTITVKAGLARRVLETSTDRERAIAEVRDVEELARQAMTDVRATVSGYRTASLPAELVGARAALQAAGIAADLPVAVDNVAAGLQETFAYVVREGVTNVIRHSAASRCEIRLGDNWLEVRDNGRVCADAVTSSRSSGGGHGLTGLAERVDAIGGELAAQPEPGGGFLLRVHVAAPREPENKDGVGCDPQANPLFSGQPTVGLT